MKPYKLVVIGASAGGPRIIKEVLDGTPRLNGAVILVQHMPKFVNKALCESLEKISDSNVKIAEHGEELSSGCIYIAPSELHLTLTDDYRINLSKGEKVHFVCPSIDVTMKSVKEDDSISKMGIILTGMGKDGAEGLCHMKSVGAVTIAQDEKTSIVYGMPKEAIKAGCVDYQLSTDEIRNKIIAFTGLLKERVF